MQVFIAYALLAADKQSTSPSVYYSFLPIFIVLAAVETNRRLREYIKLKNARRRRHMAIPQELFQNYLGKPCMLGTGNFGGNIAGIINRVEDNWLDVQTKQGNQLINTDFIVSIRLLREKETKNFRV